MTKVRFLIAAIGLSVAMAPVAPADDTVRLLAGTGSLSKATSAPTITLKGNSASDADTHQVCCWWKRYAYGAPIVYAAPAYYPPTYYAPPQATLPPPIAPMSYYYPSAPAAPEVVAVAPRVYPSSRPSIVVSYQGRFLGGSIAIRPGARLAGLARPVAGPNELMPLPRSDDTYRYDGGPTQPVPMPVPDPISPTDPVPTTVPALHRVVMEQSRRNVTYPAYGEKPVKKSVIVDPQLVKKTNP